MSPLSRLFARLWWVVPACAMAFLVWMDLRRAEQVVRITTMAGGAERWNATPAPGAPPRNALIVPGHRNDSYHWILQTQQMLRTGDWRVRRIDYENAPYGRAVAAASPYRWWLGLIAEGDHLISGRPVEACVERAALAADPILHLLLVAGTSLFVAWQFGALAGALTGLGLAGLFPLATTFLPGAPDDQALNLAVALWSLLTLLAGSQAALAANPGAVPCSRRWFAFAGSLAGFGVWIAPSSQVPLAIATGLAGLLAAVVLRGTGAPPADDRAGTLPWRIWGLAGGALVLIGYLVEFAPAHLGSWELRAVHPLYGVAWVGFAELLQWLTGGIERRRFDVRPLRLAGLAVASAAVAAVPFAMWKLHSQGFLAADLHAFRLSKLPDTPAEPTFAAWLRRDGISPAVWAVILPFLAIGPAVWLAFLRSTGAIRRLALVLALGPVLTGVGFACSHLAWWNEAGALLLALVAVTSIALSGGPVPRWIVRLWVAGFIAILVPGWLRVGARPSDADGLNVDDVNGLIERDLADWITQHGPGGGAVYVAPPNETTALTYYGAGRGLGTLSWENRDGLEAAVRILSASTPEEAGTLMRGRGITHLIIPSWDPYLERLAQVGMAKVEGTFLVGLLEWRVPAWLRPVPYRLPVVPGFEGQSITLFEVVDDQPPATALSRTAEYHLELGNLDQAAVVAQGLRRYPADLGAWTARAEVEAAQNDDEAFGKSLKVIQAYLKSKRDRTLTWDLRVGLAVVLARGKDAERAREQVKLCLDEVDAGKLRMLPTTALYRLLVLSRAYGEAFADPALHQLALDLLPPDARSRL